MGFDTTTTVDGADPLYIIVGSSTAYNDKAWGLLAWMLYAEHINMDGITATGNGACTGCSGALQLAFNSDAMGLADADRVFFTTNKATADVKIALGQGNSVHNNCWTVAHALTGSVIAKRIGISGILGSNQTCLRTVVDGYSLSGLVAISVAGSNYTSTTAQDPNDASPLNIVNTIKYSLWSALVPYTTTDYTSFNSDAGKGINIGSPVAIYNSNMAFNYVFTLISASEYYCDS